MVFQQTLSYNTAGRSTINITAEVQQLVQQFRHSNWYIPVIIEDAEKACILVFWRSCCFHDRNHTNIRA